MSTNRNPQRAEPRSRNKKDADFASQHSAKEKYHRLGHNDVGTGVESARLMWWLKFFGSALITLLAMYLYDKVVGLPRQPCTPREVQAC